jgi:hypothetical protein
MIFYSTKNGPYVTPTRDDYRNNLSVENKASN